MITSKLTERGQTTIPREVRRALRLDPGSQLIYEVRDDSVVIRKPRSFLDAYGALGKGPHTKNTDFKRARQEAREDWAAEADREGSRK